MATPSFGIFDHIEGIPGTPTPQLLKERLDLVRMADQAGFSGYYLAEHHGSDLCMAPTQEMFIAAASQITDTIRMGPMVKLLPLHHPVRLIEDMCVVDNLTNGRLDFGVGRGVAPIEHYWFGSNWPDSTQRFEDVLGIIHRALRSGEISAEGSKYYDFRTMPMATLPVQQHIPFWYPGQSGHGRQVRTQPDVAGTDRPASRTRSMSTPGTHTRTTRSGWRRPTPSPASGARCCWRSPTPRPKRSTSPSAG